MTIPPAAIRMFIDGERQETRKLLRTGDVSLRPTRVALRVYQVFDHLSDVASKPGSKMQFACEEGCAWCCRGVKVEVTAPEALAIAEWMSRSFSDDDLKQISEKLAMAAAEARVMSINDRHIARTPCFFLNPQENRCTIYPVRPLACRGHASYDSGDCERACNNPGRGYTVPKDRTMFEVAQAFTAAQTFALADEGCDSELYELTNAVHVATSAVDASSQWLNGNSLFHAARLPSDDEDRALTRQVHKDALEEASSSAVVRGGSTLTANQQKAKRRRDRKGKRRRRR